jgi:CheY-like chemotaxis protein
MRSSALVKGEAMRRQKILVVEDEMLVGMVLEEQLREQGFDVHHVLKEEDALRAVSDGAEFTLAILDFHLRDGRSPLELIDALRKQSVPIVISSGSSSDDGPSIPADLPFLPKPHREEELRALLDQLLAGARRRLPPMQHQPSG